MSFANIKSARLQQIATLRVSDRRPVTYPHATNTPKSTIVAGAR
ncbi:hypothetical protein WJR50_33605 [Catalinimonas sp. 4WD22]